MISVSFGQPLRVARFLPQHKTMRFWGITVGWFAFGLTWFSHVTEEEFARLQKEEFSDRG